MARGGKREGAGRKAAEPTKTVRIPAALVEAVAALVRLRDGSGTVIDFATVDIAVAKSAFCADRGIDTSNTALLREAVKELQKLADETDEAAAEKAAEWHRVAIYGIDA